MSRKMNNPDPIFINLYKPGEFEKFFKGFLDFLQKNLSQRKVIGKNYSYSYFTCGQPHDPRNPDWKPFKLLSEYCKKTGDPFDVAKSMIEDCLGRRLLCECEILNDEREIRRMELKGFGVDFGAPGRRELDIL